jgi:predicted aspartyl protease
METHTFALADSAHVNRKVSECRIALNAVERHSPVIRGEPGDDPLLGAITLEVLGLFLDPLQARTPPNEAPPRLIPSPFPIGR